MKTIQDYIDQSEDKAYYTREYENLSTEQKEKFEGLVLALDSENASRPLGWALSETTENIAQFSRFLFLKGMFDIANDVEGNIDLALDVDEDYEEDIFEVAEKLEEVIGKKELNDFLKSYSKGMMWQIFNFIDEGNYNSEDKPMWTLKEDKTNRNIGGLHENFDGFEEELKSKS